MKQPTKLNKNKNKNKDIVTIGDEWTGEDRPSYLCSWCNCTLSKLQDAGKNNTTYFCTRCAIEFDPESEHLRKESKLIVPNRNEPAVSTTPGIPDISIRHTPPLRGGFAEMAKKGTIRITDYKTTEKE